jgi:hypothetical protein
MGTPDMLGTYGTYQHYADDGPPQPVEEGGGKRFRLTFERETAKARIVGPEHTFLKQPRPVSVEFLVHRDRQAGADRWAVGKARQPHQTRKALHHDVIRRFLSSGSILAKTRDTAVYELGIQLRQSLVAKAQPVHDARPKVLNHHIALQSQRRGNLAPLRALQVYAYAPLVPIRSEVIAAVPIPERPPATGLIPSLGHLDLDHLRSHVSQQLGTKGARHGTRKIEYPDPG